MHLLMIHGELLGHIMLILILVSSCYFILKQTKIFKYFSNATLFLYAIAVLATGICSKNINWKRIIFTKEQDGRL